MTETTSEPSPEAATTNAEGMTSAETAVDTPAPRRWRRRLLLGLVSIAALVVLLFWGVPRVIGQLPAPLAALLLPPNPEAVQQADQMVQENATLKARLTELEARLTAIEQRLTALEARPAPDSTVPVADIMERLSALESRPIPASGLFDSAQLAESKARDVPIDSSALEALSARLTALEAAKPGFGPAVGVAFAQLQRASLGAAPFLTELNAFAKAADQEIPADLEAAATRGVTNLSALQAQFPAAARAALKALHRDPEAGFLAALQARISGLIIRRPAREVAGDSPGALLSQAEARLREGDLVATLRVLDKLPKEAQAAMASWMAQAQARTDLDAAIADIGRFLMGL